MNDDARPNPLPELAHPPAKEGGWALVLEITQQIRDLRGYAAYNALITLMGMAFIYLCGRDLAGFIIAAMIAGYCIGIIFYLLEFVTGRIVTTNARRRTLK